ncbi:hypothetical protein [Paenibacillus sp. 1011MAR3C5]|nr:hypothetical protein [Paenibacillus sp. 1011MAR3C5]
MEVTDQAEMAAWMQERIRLTGMEEESFRQENTNSIKVNGDALEKSKP